MSLYTKLNKRKFLIDVSFLFLYFWKDKLIIIIPFVFIKNYIIYLFINLFFSFGSNPIKLDHQNNTLNLDHHRDASFYLFIFFLKLSNFICLYPFDYLTCILHLFPLIICLKFC